MPPERYPPDDPLEWLNRARSNLARAGANVIPEVFFEDLCFDCQQTAEKALKALLVSKKTPFPKTHDIAGLLTLIQNAGFSIPPDILEAAKLTEYAVESRYPGTAEPVTEEEYHAALSAAGKVLKWAEGLLGK